MKTILIIDDDIAVTTSMNLLLKNSGFQVITASNPIEAIRQVNSHTCNLIIQDMNFSAGTSGDEGIDLLKQIKAIDASIPVILITAWGSIALAVEGMKLGAADFINKPWNNDHLLQTINTILSVSKNLYDTKSITRRKLDEKFDFQNIIGESPSFLNILQTVGKIAKTNASILITGESGTGKEVIADAIHHNSNRTNNAFVKVNLGGIPSTLFESEMFGHKKGSFTDAKTDRIGRFEMADNGTIFLDELGDLSLNNQVKLLRVLQERSFEMLGSSTTKSVDFRLISATNKDLKKLVEEQEFREDLFYRINLITIKLPSLQERKDDIPLLANYFVEALKKDYGDDDLAISQSASKWLSEQLWPGNIRELKNLVERTALIANKSILEIKDFEAQQQNAPKNKGDLNLPPVGAMTIDEVEITMIKKALIHHKNNLSKVAKSLGLSRSALYRRLEKYEIDYK